MSLSVYSSKALGGCRLGVCTFILAAFIGATPDWAAAQDPITVTTESTADCDTGGLRFTVIICNTSADTLQDVIVNNTLPIGMAFVSNSLSSDVPAALCEPPAGQTIRICLGTSLDSGECATVTFSAVFSEALCNHVVVTASGPPVSNGDEGCTPGYWKNHFAAWQPTGFSPSDDFDTVFGVNAFHPNRTLEQALNQGGGGIRALGRHAVAALLNASHPDVDYGMSAAQVIQTVQDAVAQGGGAIEAAKDALEALNEMGCPLGGGCGGGGSGSSGGSQQTVSVSQTLCLDALLGQMVNCVCEPPPPPGPCNYVELIQSFCVSTLPEGCDANINTTLNCFSDFETATFNEIVAAELAILEARCAQFQTGCCIDNPTADICAFCDSVFPPE